MDLLQVKYEMIRKVHQEGVSIAETASSFGFSRPAFYEAQAALQQEGLMGLMPKKRGPQAAHKLSSAIIQWVKDELEKNSQLTSADLVERVLKKFDISVHPRSIERALDRGKKK